MGRTESQTFLALVEFESKKKRTASKENKGYMERFEKGVKEKEERLSLVLAEGEKAAYVFLCQATRIEGMWFGD